VERSKLVRGRGEGREVVLPYPGGPLNEKQYFRGEFLYSRSCTRLRDDVRHDAVHSSKGSSASAKSSSFSSVCQCSYWCGQLVKLK
jgi:hypothetical protein